MSWIELYIWTRVDALSTMLGIIASIAGLAFMLLTVFYIGLQVDGTYEDEVKKLKRYLKPATIAFAVSMTLAMLTPSKADLALMYGMHWATNNEDVRALPDEAVKLIREWLNEARPNNGGKQ